MVDQDYKDKYQTITEHIVELRIRVVRIVCGLFIVGLAAWHYTPQIMDIIRAPIVPYLPNHGLVFTAVMEKFLVHLKVTVLTAVIFSCPWWLYQVWAFITPALYRKEKKYALSFLFSGSFLFLSGAAFAYFLVFPAAFKYLLTFGGTTDQAFITIGEYISFFTVTTMIFGVAFELPLILVMLGLLGIIDQKLLREKRRVAIVLLATISAVVTPPDLLSMMMLLVPLALLYEISIIIVGIIAKKKAV